MSVVHSHWQLDAALQTGWLVCVGGQARIAVVAFLSIALVLVILSADRMHNLTCVPLLSSHDLPTCWVYLCH